MYPASRGVAVKDNSINIVANGSGRAIDLILFLYQNAPRMIPFCYCQCEYSFSLTCKSQSYLNISPWNVIKSVIQFQFNRCLTPVIEYNIEISIYLVTLITGRPMVNGRIICTGCGILRVDYQLLILNTDIDIASDTVSQMYSLK